MNFGHGLSPGRLGFLQGIERFVRCAGPEGEASSAELQHCDGERMGHQVVDIPGQPVALFLDRLRGQLRLGLGQRVGDLHLLTEGETTHPTDGEGKAPDEHPVEVRHEGKEQDPDDTGGPDHGTEARPDR